VHRVILNLFYQARSGFFVILDLEIYDRALDAVVMMDQLHQLPVGQLYGCRLFAIGVYDRRDESRIAQVLDFASSGFISLFRVQK
jgi:hypothetical protein